MDTDILAQTDSQPHVPDDVATLPAVFAYYKMAGPVIEASFGGDPIVYANFPHGFGDRKAYYKITDVPLSASKLLWLVHREYALEFHGWAPLATDEDRLRFARILITHGPSFERRRVGALRMREHLHEDGVDGAIVLDGCDGFALWIPLADAPHAAVARAWLHRVCDRAVAADPDLFTTEPNTHDPTRVHLHVTSNARHLHSALPYSLRGAPDLPMVTPIPWESVADEDAKYEQVYAENFVEYMQGYGDVFSREVKRIGEQRLPDAPRPLVTAPDLESLDSATHGHCITATIAILEDGKARTADQILAEALARKLVPPATTKKYIYSALIEYIARWLGRGRKPQIVQDAERQFRINEPPDDWPDLVPFPAPQPDTAVDALVARLESTSTGNDPAAFEIACCDVFAHLGFRTQHLGGHANPDGIADAQLGPLAYRVMLECKSAPVHRKPSRPHGGGVVIKPDVAEAAKFVTAFDADFAVLLGPDFENEIELLNELKTHKVTAFTVSDLATLLHLRVNPLEIRTVLEPGFAMEAIADLVWERRHGRVKRIATVAALVQKEGWLAQCAAADQDIHGSLHAGNGQQGASGNTQQSMPGNGQPANAGKQHDVDAQQSANGNGRLNRGDAPRLTVDAAMLLVDQALRAAGSTQACRREEVEAAFTHLTDPLVGSATWLAPSRQAVAILRASSISIADAGTEVMASAGRRVAMQEWVLARAAAVE